MPWKETMFEQVKTQRISDEIVRQIRDALFAGKLRVGDKLPTERMLAEQFGTSRTSLREAVRGLEQQGIIQVKKGVTGGLFIADVDHRSVSKSLHTLLQLGKVSIHHIAEVRMVFEPEAARLAAQRARPEDLQELEEVIQKMAALVKTGKRPTFFDLKFHKLVARAAGNPIFEMLAESMLEVASQVITEINPSIAMLRHVLKCHREVFDAIRNRNGDLAFEAMSAHIVDIQERLAAGANRKRRTNSGSTRGKTFKKSVHPPRI